MANPFENRRWLVIPSTIVESINFDQVHEFNESSLRYSLDGSQTFVKYDINIIEEDKGYMIYTMTGGKDEDSIPLGKDNQDKGAEYYLLNDAPNEKQR